MAKSPDTRFRLPKKSLDALFRRQRRLRQATLPTRCPHPSPTAGCKGHPSVGCGCAAGVDNAWTAHRNVRISGFGFAVPGSRFTYQGRGVDRSGFPSSPADRRVADALAEAMHCIHAQRDARHEAAAGARGAGRLLLVATAPDASTDSRPVRSRHRPCGVHRSRCCCSRRYADHVPS